MNIFNSVKNWEFLEEPLYRWAIFFVAICIFAMVWKNVLKYMA